MVAIASASRDMWTRPGVFTQTRQGAANTYLITWVCYGAWLPGQSGAVPRSQNRYRGPLPEPDMSKEQESRSRMTQPPYLMDAPRRRIVLKSVQEVCCCRRWNLLAVHVRTNHVHVVTTADRTPVQVMIAMKAYSSRALNRSALDGPEHCRWARHASTRYLWTRDSVRAAIEYVVRGQGESMSVFEEPSPR
jgi:REP element-mobilizing transposase RayT